MDGQRRIDWEGLATRAMDTAITVIGNRLQGVRTPVGMGGTVTGSGVSFWSSSNILPFMLAGAAIIGAVMIFKGK
jgi:hypothetical protein